MSEVRDMLEALLAEHLSVFGIEACPQWAKDSFDRYVSDGIPTGDFLRAVLANDLMGAVSRADVDSGRKLAAIVSYVYNRLPAELYGSAQIVDMWVQHCHDQRVAAKDGAP